MVWILILFVHAGILSGKDSMAITDVKEPFLREVDCNEAGKKAEALTTGTTKNVKFVCLPKKLY